jgi:hypothetical protein
MALRELLPDRLTALDAFVVERVLSDGAEGKGSINGAPHVLARAARSGSVHRLRR